MDNQNERIQELFLLQRVAQKLNSILDLDVLLEEIVNDVIQTFDYVRSGVLLKIEETNELEIVAVRGWTVNYHIKGDRFKIGEYGMIGHVAETGETYYAPDVRVDKYYQVSEVSTRSEVDIPLKINEKLIGVFNIQHNDVDAFKPERIQLLEGLANHIAIAIENARLFRKERIEKEKVLSELYEAASIQANLLPKTFPVVPGFNISAICLPSREVGGDWFDFFPLSDGKLGIVLADVSGKGMGAALLMSSTRSILRLIAFSNPSPKEVLQRVNEILIKDIPSAKFVTMIYAVLDPAEKVIRFSNAGHLYPLFRSSDHTEFVETVEGMPLGITECSFSEHKIEFTSGSKLIFYTDGVTEAFNPELEEYGTERLKSFANNHDISIQGVISDVNSFIKGNSYSDDVTLVMIEAE